MNKTKIHVVADENISGLEYFESIANVSTVSGRTLSTQDLKNADALLVRSVSRINKDLLKNTGVKFVASATSGIDHVDLDFLQANDIHFSHAPGSNANSVVQYVVASMAFLSDKYGFDWRDLSVGIIGAGNVGGLLADYLDKLNIKFVIYDPYLDESHRFSDNFAGFDEVLQQGLLTLHTPLTRDGRFPTWHLFNERVIQSLSADSMLINTSRGAVIDNQALSSEYEKQSWRCVLDVWENEPEVYMPLLQQVDIATCHIAGYSYEGKEQGSAQIYRAFVDYFDLCEAPAYPINTDSKVLRAPVSTVELEQINQTILNAYAIAADHQEMLQLAQQTSTTTFDELRKQYSLRREFQYFSLDNTGFTPEAKIVLRTLGFN